MTGVRERNVGACSDNGLVVDGQDGIVKQSSILIGLSSPKPAHFQIGMPLQ